MRISEKMDELKKLYERRINVLPVEIDRRRA